MVWLSAAGERLGHTFLLYDAEVRRAIHYRGGVPTYSYGRRRDESPLRERSVGTYVAQPGVA